MNEKNRRRSLCQLLAVTALLTAAAVAIGTTYDRAEAVVIGGPHVCSYYSDATFSTVVGARGEGCCGTPISWGITTPFKTCERLLCPAVVCPN
jgi:hypothetical protein